MQICGVALAVDDEVVVVTLLTADTELAYALISPAIRVVVGVPAVLAKACGLAFFKRQLPDPSPYCPEVSVPKEKPVQTKPV